MKEASVISHQKTKLFPLGFLIPILFFKMSKTQKDLFKYQKSWKNAQLHLYQKTDPTYFGVLILILFLNFQKLKH